MQQNYYFLLAFGWRLLMEMDASRKQFHTCCEPFKILINNIRMRPLACLRVLTLKIVSLVSIFQASFTCLKLVVSLISLYTVNSIRMFSITLYMHAELHSHSISRWQNLVHYSGEVILMSLEILMRIILSYRVLFYFWGSPLLSYHSWITYFRLCHARHRQCGRLLTGIPPSDIQKLNSRLMSSRLYHCLIAIFIISCAGTYFLFYSIVNKLLERELRKLLRWIYSYLVYTNTHIARSRTQVL